MRKPFLLGLLFACIGLFLPVARADQKASSFEKKKTETVGLQFLLSFPEGYEEDEARKWPLMIFLHGAGERGDDLTKVKIHGPPMRVEEGTAFPFILASPQCPEGEWWTEQPVLELVDHLEKTYRVDSSRIYLTGLSMGGYGSWHFVCEAPNRFAAVVPVCGGGTPYKMRWIKDVPIWAFHGDQDSVVPPEESSRLVEELKRQGSKEARLTIYPGVGHNSWTEAYNNAELYDWMLSHILPSNK